MRIDQQIRSKSKVPSFRQVSKKLSALQYRTDTFPELSVSLRGDKLLRYLLRQCNFLLDVLRVLFLFLLLCSPKDIIFRTCLGSC